ncbi:hypothetical protein [Mesobacillus maritimus]|uniref:Uncharacterized protein n=1 Tax=Mesobacillus maritimus TaxID=1643336 RepID=A0ABS7K4W1_9BACI|nr:hypothetical protein [Mesobacillus maritimus]MBY0097302.1 hypothetical protein [Mesobacillus maritimus]
MSRLYLLGTFLLFSVLQFGCSLDSSPAEANNGNEQKSRLSTNKNPSKSMVLTEKDIKEDQGENSRNDSVITIQEKKQVSLEEMEPLKETLRTFIFDEYMGSSEYVYAKGINWSENFFDNLTAEEVWTIIEEHKEENNGETGTLFEQAHYLSVHAPIKNNWKELFLEEWYSGPYSEEIETMIDKGDSVWIFTETIPYTGEEDNYPIITLYKNTGSWNG